MHIEYFARPNEAENCFNEAINAFDLFVGFQLLMIVFKMFKWGFTICLPMRFSILIQISIFLDPINKF